jgi:hypothetical protein
MNERWNTFDRIWAKGQNGKMRQRLMAKCVQRKLEPTEENCRDYWMGYIRYYKDTWTGKDFHLNPRKNKTRMKALKRNKNATRRKGSSGKPYTMGRRRPPKNKGHRRG